MSQDIHFNLLDEAWIPCESLAGEPLELGLISLFEQAHQLRGLRGESALVVPSLMRVLLALLHRAFQGPKDEQAWKSLWERASFEMKPLGDYLESWRTRFDLFDKERPFYQHPGMNYSPRKAASLIGERSGYGAPVDLFEHRPEGFPVDLSPGEAARQLIVTQNFALGGLTSRSAGEPPSAAAAPLASGAVVLISGRNLFETLLLNLLPYDPSKPKPLKVPADPKRDRPSWEWEEVQPKKPGEKRDPYGWLDLLTWQSRRVFLKAERQHGHIRVLEVILAGGFDLSTEHVREPMMAFRTIEKIGEKALKFNPDRVLWRDSAALFRLRPDKNESLAPQACESLCERIENEWVPRDRNYSLDLYGLSNDQMRILLFRHERMPLPPALLLNNKKLAGGISKALDLCEKTRNALMAALRAVAQSAVSPGFDDKTQTGRKPRAEDLTKIVSAMGAEGAFWASMREPFEQLIADICDPKIGADAALDLWKQKLRRIARQGFRHGSESLGQSARVLKGSALGERTLAFRLKEALGESNPKQEQTP